jgi:N-carbamoylputrescine amidase
VSAEEILIEELDLDALDVQRTHWPFFRDRRVDAYEGLDQRFLEDSHV